MGKDGAVAAAEVTPTPSPDTGAGAASSAPTPTPESTEIPAGKVQIPDEPAPPGPPKLQLTPEIAGWLETHQLPADETGLKAILGHLDQQIEEGLAKQQQHKEEQTRKQVGDSRSRVRDRIHAAVEEKLKGFHGKGLSSETLEMLKELAWTVTDQSLMMSAAMNQSHTAEELARSRQEDRELWSLLRDPQYEPLLNQAFEIQELSRRFNLPADKVAEIAKVFQPKPDQRQTGNQARGSSRYRGQTEVGGGFPLDEGNARYDKLEKAMDALLKEGKDPSEIWKKANF